MNMRLGMITGFSLVVSVITYQSLTKCKQLPWPPRIVLTGLVFALLDLFSEIQAELAGTLAVGFVLAAIINREVISDCSAAFTTDSTNQPRFTSFHPEEASGIPQSYTGLQQSSLAGPVSPAVAGQPAAQGAPGSLATAPLGQPQYQIAPTYPGGPYKGAQ